MTASPAKLKSGAWGARVEGRVAAGDTITIKTQSGKSWRARVERVVWTDGQVALCATQSLDRPEASARQYYNAPAGPVSHRRRAEPPAGPRISRKQGAARFRVGEVGASWLTPEEIGGCESRQKVTATPVLGIGDGGIVGREPRADGRRLVAYVVAWAKSYTDDEVEDFDAWSHQHEAIVRLATPEEAAPLIAERERSVARHTAAADWQALVTEISGVVDGLPVWAQTATPIATWGKPDMVHTGAYPALFIGDEEAYYYVPGYFACDWDYPAIHRTAPLTDELRERIEDVVGRCRDLGLLRQEVTP